MVGKWIRKAAAALTSRRDPFPNPIKAIEIEITDPIKQVAAQVTLIEKSPTGKFRQAHEFFQAVTRFVVREGEIEELKAVFDGAFRILPNYYGYNTKANSNDGIVSFGLRVDYSFHNVLIDAAKQFDGPRYSDDAKNILRDHYLNFAANLLVNQPPYLEKEISAGDKGHTEAKVLEVVVDAIEKIGTTAGHRKEIVVGAPIDGRRPVRLYNNSDRLIELYSHRDRGDNLFEKLDVFKINGELYVSHFYNNDVVFTGPADMFEQLLDKMEAAKIPSFHEKSDAPPSYFKKLMDEARVHLDAPRLSKFEPGSRPAIEHKR